MKHVTIWGVSGAAAAVLVAGLVGPATAGLPRASAKMPAVGLTADNKLVSFSVDKPTKSSAYVAVKGLVGDKSLVGIDYRVQDGKLYGVGDQGGVYTLKPSTGAATKVSQLTVALQGTTFGVDFNPAADRLRVVSDTGQNLRHNVGAGGTTIADTTLAYTAPTAAVGVTAVAYTNNDLSATTATTLYDIDTTLNQVALQVPANSGQLSAVGALGVDATADAGFDIYSPVRKGVATDGVGYAVLKVGSGTALYKISLVTGRADKLGALPTKWQVVDLAVGLSKS